MRGTEKSSTARVRNSLLPKPFDLIRDPPQLAGYRCNKVPSNFQRRVTQTYQRPVRGGVLIFLDQPTSRFGNEVDTQKQRDCWNARRAKLKSLGNVSHVLTMRFAEKPRIVSQRHPHLPQHDKGSSNVGRGVLGGKQRGRSPLF